MGRMLLASIMRETRPDGLFQYLGKYGYSMSDPYKGIYYIEGNVLFPTQIVVTGELDEESHIFVKEILERCPFVMVKQYQNGEKHYDRHSVKSRGAECRHIAAAILVGCDFIISWNFKHIVNVKTIRGIKAITTYEGYG